MLSFIKFINIVLNLTRNKCSLLRILQIIKIKKIEISNSLLDIGGTKDPRNISFYFPGKYKKKYVDKFSSDQDIYKLDLEEINIIHEKYDFVCLLNILEHIKNYKNTIKLSYDALTDRGTLIGSVPFMFKVHYSPKDYFRFTNQLLEEELKDAGFTDIRIEPLGLGPFTNMYSALSDYFMKLSSWINVFLILVCIILDKLFNLFNKKFSRYYPLGYFFIAKKNN